MLKKLKLFPLNLKAFDGEGAGAGGTGGTGAAPAGTTGTPGSSQQVQTGEKVVYGKPPAEGATEDGKGSAAEGNKANENTPPAKTKEQKAAEFEVLIKGDFKDVFTERTQAIINQRFANTKELETKLSAVNPLIDLLSARYNETDPAKIAQLITNDDAMWEPLADEAGMSVEQYKNVVRMQAENKRLKQTESQIESEKLARQQYDTWQNQAKEMVSDPAFAGLKFDLDAEADSNPQFVSLLKAGIDVKTAYQVSHIDDIKQATARTVEESVVNNIKARGNRPAENGVNGVQAQVTYKSDPSKLTREDRQKIRKQVANGEKISF